MFTTITLSGRYREIDPQVTSLARAGSENFVFVDFYRRCAAICDHGKVDHVLVAVESSFECSSAAGLEEIRSQLMRVRNSGKELLLWSSDISDTTLYLASACNRRFMSPVGSLSNTGIASPSIYLRRLLDRLHVEVEIVRRGKFKSAAEGLRRQEMDEADREQREAYLADVVSRRHQAVLDGYGKSVDALEELLSGVTLDAAGAIERGWIDEAVSLSDLRKRLKDDQKKEAKIKVRSHIGRGKRVAVLVFEGSIIDGRSRELPLLGQSIGSSDFVGQIERLRKDKKVAAVVLRVNSGGGSATASEEIRCALAQLDREKPVIMSMGSTAASGGYWISATGRKLFALPGTLTGSIGAVSATINALRGFEEIGVTETTVKTHESADRGTIFRAPTEADLADMERQIESTYQEFLSLVSRVRGKSADEIDQVAQGRIWSGERAAGHGLIDELGGLHEAISEAQSQAGLRRSRIVFGPSTKPGLVQRILSKRLSPSSQPYAGLGSGALRLLELTDPAVRRALSGTKVILPELLLELPLN